MGRSRSRSPQRKERRRSRSKDRDRERRRHHRSRSRSPHRRSHSGSPYRAGSPENDDVVFIGTSKLPAGQRPAGSTKRSRRKHKRAAELADDVEMVEIEEDGLNEADMMKMMGFSDFNSTKGKHVPGNDVYVANIVQKRKYRQYMNRRGGFNRPLDFVA